MSNTAHPVLLLTHDANLWQRWRAIDSTRWMPARGATLEDLARWRDAKRSFVILDSHLPRRPAWEDPAWSELSRDTHIIVASSRPDDGQAAQALAAGCSGYLHAYSPPEVLGRALESIASGGVWMGRSLVSRMLKDISRRLPASSAWTQGLTEREIEVARQAAHGRSNQDIADALGISERTVRAHLSATFEKLGVQDRLQLALRVHGIH